MSKPTISSTSASVQTLSRRAALKRVLGAAGAVALPAWIADAAQPATAAPGKRSFIYCLNTGTIRGQKLGIVGEIQVAAQAGYQAIEPWIASIGDYAKAGGSLPELRTRLQDSGLTVESAIGFPQWIVDDDAARAKGLEQARRDMDLVAQIGGKRIAAPPAGATQKAGLDLVKAAERYRALLELGERMGVVPQLELWGGSKNLHLLGEVAFVAIESGHPNACVVADVFHIYKGGSDFRGLRLFSAGALPVFHLNDYPAEPGRDQINDGHRVYPGDGVAPLKQILRDLRSGGGTTVLSLELFNPTYWEQDALQVARNGLAKMQAAVAAIGT